jgi:hypothetical protein
MELICQWNQDRIGPPFCQIKNTQGGQNPHQLFLAVKCSSGSSAIERSYRFSARLALSSHLSCISPRVRRIVGPESPCPSCYWQFPDPPPHVHRKRPLQNFRPLPKFSCQIKIQQSRSGPPPNTARVGPAENRVCRNQGCQDIWTFG